jgi:inhibitor of KinA
LPSGFTHHIFPLGDSAIIIDFRGGIEEEVNKKVLHVFEALMKLSLPGVKDIVPSFNSLAVHYDLYTVRKKTKTTLSMDTWINARVEDILSEMKSAQAYPARSVSIPVCYETPCAPDLAWLAGEKNLPAEEIIKIHTSKSYRVYMLGFLPGFPYLGSVDERISVDRKAKPAPVVAGSIGIAGMQTGIYPVDCPGGWHIIGRTPLKIFTPGEADITLLHPGDAVNFYSISLHEFENSQTWHT